LDPEADESKRRKPVEGVSSNHFELAFTEFEFLLDFGQAYDDSRDALIHTRIIMTPRSAKTLAAMLDKLIAQYEETVNPIRERNS
jgi:Protein of unknown function (DUF3467)